MKIVTIIGARPQIIKSSALTRAIKDQFSSQLEEIVVHTGQHYDKNMSEVFFNELGIPKPDYNLGIGSKSHGAQAAAMIEGIEKILISEQPQALVVYGDTNSTLAGAVAASKIGIPVIHIEAGLRSYNKSMPEEINRVICDHLSTLLFSPTNSGLENLKKEGFAIENKAPFTIDNPKVYHCGDIMYDNSLHYSALVDQKATVLQENNLEHEAFILCTVHRNHNTDNAERLSSIVNALLTLAKTETIVLPIHPRTKKALETNLPKSIYQDFVNHDKIKIIPPQSFLNIIALQKSCHLVITDSGGLQKEAFFFEKPCVILRPETEWLEIVKNENAIIADANQGRILKAVERLSNKNDFSFPPFYGDGKAATFICQTLLNEL